MSLAEKLHAIQSLARRVAKRGVNPEQGWEYLQIEDAVALAKREMRKHKLILTPALALITDQQGVRYAFTRVMSERGSGSTIDLVLTWTLEDVETGETKTYDLPGSGWDYNDKGVFKAMTGSRKYAIVLIFNLAVGNDVEERGAMSRDNAKDRAQQIADEKLANAAAGKSIDANVPALFWQWFEESRTALVTGDKELMRRNADLVKEFKLGGKVILSEAQLEALKLRLEERGIPFRKLQTA